MAVSGSVVGREVIMGMGKGSTWGTPNGTLDHILISEDGLEFEQPLSDVEESGDAFLKDTDLDPITAAMNFGHWVRFDEVRGMLYAIGSENYAAPSEANTGKGDYQHFVYPSDDNFGLYLTTATQKGSYIEVANSTKIAGFELTGQSSPQRLSLKYTTMSDTIDSASTAVTTSDFSTVTLREGNAGKAFFRNVVLRVNDQSGSALTASDNVANIMTNFTLSFQRNLTGDYTNTAGLLIEEPVEDAYPECILTFNMRNVDDTLDGFFTDYKAKTSKKVSLLATGAAATTATGTVAAGKILFEFPLARFTTVPAPAMTDTGIIRGGDVVMKMYKPGNATVSGMTFDNIFKCTVINAQSAKQTS